MTSCPDPDRDWSDWRALAVRGEPYRMPLTAIASITVPTSSPRGVLTWTPTAPADPAPEYAVTMADGGDVPGIARAIGCLLARVIVTGFDGASMAGMCADCPGAAGCRGRA